MADIDRVIRRLERIPERMRFAQQVAINRTAKLAQAALKEEMVRVFDRPTPFALNSTYIAFGKYRRDTQQSAETIIGIRGYAFKVRGNAGGYMRAEVYGEDRPLKNSELRLRSAGILPSDRWIVPGAAAKIDRYGNMDKGQIVAVLSKLGTIREAIRSEKGGRRGGKRKAKYADAIYFVSDGSGQLARGIWQKTQGGVRPIMMFVRKPNYKPRLAFERIVKEVVELEYPRVMRETLMSILKE